MNPSLTIKGSREPGRNDPCPCGSELKYKWCHGDLGKRAVCERIMAEAMTRLIMREKHKRGMITDEQLEAILNPSESEGEGEQEKDQEVYVKNVDQKMWFWLANLVTQNIVEIVITGKHPFNRRD
jgi:hypothetical protein